MLDPMPIGEAEPKEPLKCEMCGLDYIDEKNYIHVDETGCCVSCFNSIK